MTATLVRDCNTREPVLYVALELGWNKWLVAFASEQGQPPRLRSLRARDLRQLDLEIAKAKARFGLPPETRVRSCYEAGRDGFWLHRYLVSRQVENLILDASSIEVPRRFRRAKSDQLDACKLLQLLFRHYGGEKHALRIVHVPSVEDEDGRQLHRDLLVLKKERTEHVNRIKGLLASCGLAAEVRADFLERLAQLRLWDDSAVPAQLQQRLEREFQRWQLLGEQIEALEKERLQELRCSPEEQLKQARRLLELVGVGENGAWLLVREIFGWRGIQNRRQLGALAGLTPPPYQSGDSAREQGISKAGNRRLRLMMIELAWNWLIHQPQSALSMWYQRRYAGGPSRIRKIGIVALARKLLVAFWKYLKHGEVPQGAKTVPWRVKLHCQRQARVAGMVG